ncbi:MAG: ATP-dependent zinc protease family protein [Acidiferrobacterales bacterium]
MSKALLFQVIVITFVSIAAPASAKEVVGWVENAKIYPGGIQIKSKIDTGAKTSSLNCQCITPIKRDGEDWVSFSVKNSDGDITKIEKPVLRVAKIRRFFGKSQERFVIKLGICLANVYREEEVTLMDRSGFNYQMLIGRNFTRGDFLVDPGMTFITRPSCKQAPRK